MKIKLFILSFLALIGFASCSSDNDSPQENNVTNVVGNYSGFLLAKIGEGSYFECPSQQLAVLANDNGTARVVYKSDDFGYVVIDNATVTKKDNKYVLTGNGQLVYNLDSSPSEYTCSMTAEITNNENASFSFTVPTFMNGVYLDFIVGENPFISRPQLGVVGKYSGELLVSVMGEFQGEDDVTCKLDAEDDSNKVKATLSGVNIYIESVGVKYYLGDIVMDTLSVTRKSDNLYEIVGNVDTKTSINGEELRLTGKFKGKVQDGYLMFVVTLRPDNMPIDIEGEFVVVL